MVTIDGIQHITIDNFRLLSIYLEEQLGEFHVRDSILAKSPGLCNSLSLKYAKAGS